MKPYSHVVEELASGSVADLLTGTVADTAKRVLANDRAGEITLTLKIKPVKGSQTQVVIDSTVKYKMPTLKGNKGEEATDSTLMHVSSKGELSVTPHAEYTLPGADRPVNV